MEVATKGANSTPRIEMVLSKLPKALDWKSKEGITPLLLAFSLRRIPAVQYLIKAGADQTLRDIMSRNVLHYILRPHNDNRPASLESLKTMLELVDKRLIKSMFLERCSCEPTSLTPLAYWLHGGFGDYRKDDSFAELQEMLNTILDYSGNEVLELMDGAGDYPLHFLVKKGYHMLIPVILNRNPSLLFRENAVGITPLEMCNTKYLRDYIDHPPFIEGHHSVPRPLEETLPSEFVPKKSQSMSHHSETRRICLEAAKAHTSQKRKLVSLFDANAVAKRLASRKARRIGMDRIADVTNQGQNEDEDEGADEVADWYQRAAPVAIN
jgi:ankyrin repeat protein